MRTYSNLSYLLVAFNSTLLVSAATTATSAKQFSSNLTVLSTPNIRAHCVSGEEWSDWRGEIDYQNCWAALAILKARVPHDHAYVFWSGKDSDRPPPMIPRPWRLSNYADAGKQSPSSYRLGIGIWKDTSYR